MARSSPSLRVSPATSTRRGTPLALRQRELEQAPCGGYEAAPPVEVTRLDVVLLHDHLQAPAAMAYPSA